MKKQISSLLLVCAAIFAFAGCTKRAEIEGGVVDGQGHFPVFGVAVAEDGTQFKATTDGQGHYSIPYVPGHVTLTFTHQGYLGKTVSYDLAAADKVPASTVILISYPFDNVFQTYIKGIIPLQGGHVFMGGDYKLGQMMDVSDVKIGAFTERSATEVTAPVTITCKAKVDIDRASQATMDWGNLTGVGGQSAGDVWTHSFIGEFRWDDKAMVDGMAWQFVGVARPD